MPTILRAANTIGPDGGGAVMATGIVSVVLRLHGWRVPSRVLLVIACALWAILAVLFAWRLAADRARWRHEASRAASLTAVAGTAVLGVRATQLGWGWAAWMALMVAAVAYVTLLPLGAYAARRAGSVFLLVVAPQSLAVLAAEVARREHAAWLALAALAPFALGVCWYAPALVRYDLRGLRSEPGEHWIAGGALAITTLACAELTQAAGAIATLHALEAALRVCTIVLWAISIAWLPVLAAAEVRWPRPRYRAARWATIFPLGMYAAMSFAAAVAIGAPWIGRFADAWSWVALAGWAAAAAGLARRARTTLAGT